MQTAKRVTDDVSRRGGLRVSSPLAEKFFAVSRSYQSVRLLVCLPCLSSCTKKMRSMVEWTRSMQSPQVVPALVVVPARGLAGFVPPWQRSSPQSLAASVSAFVRLPDLPSSCSEEVAVHSRVDMFPCRVVPAHAIYPAQGLAGIAPY